MSPPPLSRATSARVLRQLGVGDHLGRDLCLNGVVASPLMSNALRTRLLRGMGLRLGAKVQISPRCFFGGSDVVVGRGTFVNWDCFFDNLGPIRIGDGCNIGMGARFITSHHEVGSAPVGKPVVVGDRCWIGAYSIIVPGVTIGDDCVVGAGSVVTHDLEAGGRYAGNPAKALGGSPRHEA
jgi:maltose O-acetyltransferase